MVLQGLAKQIHLLSTVPSPLISMRAIVGTMKNSKKRALSNNVGQDEMPPNAYYNSWVAVMASGLVSDIRHIFYKKNY